MEKKTYRLYQCPGCGEGTGRAEGWRGVFCSEECRVDAQSVRVMRKEIETGKLSAGTQAMKAVWEELMRFKVNYLKNLPPRSSALYERVFFPEPVYPADGEEWPSTWQGWKKEREVSEPYEAYDFSS